MIYSGLYYFHGASSRGKAQNPVKYFVNPEMGKSIGIVKRQRKTNQRLIVTPFTDKQGNYHQFFFEYPPKTSLKIYRKAMLKALLIYGRDENERTVQVG